MRKVGAFLFGYIGPRKQELSAITWNDVDYRRAASPQTNPAD